MEQEQWNNQIQHPDELDFTDVKAKTVLPKWKRDTSALRILFSDDYEKADARRTKKGSSRTVVYLTYENPWGKAGGIAAVASMLPRKLANAGENVLRLSPLHSNLVTQPKSKDKLGECEVGFAGSQHKVSIYLAVDSIDNEWYLFGAEGLFNADGGTYGKDPYVYSDENKEGRDGDHSKLLRDSLFAAKAVPEVLIELGKTENLLIHAQDWEFASAALTTKEALLAHKLESASVVLTLHNPFDHSLSDANLSKITSRWQSHHWSKINGDDRKTVLSRMIPLTDAPVSTVSHRFAQEFCGDPLQTGHFAKHYQRILAQQQIIGIDNGLFEDLNITSSYQQAIERAICGDLTPILKEKLKARRHMLQTLQQYLDDKKDSVFGTLDGGDGRPLVELPDDVPVFLMIGRLDPGQKGFDVFNRFIETAPKGFGRYVVSPLSSLAFDPDFQKHFDDLKSVAQSRQGEAVFIPFRLDFEIFLALRAGVTWSVWPSLYEPFGGVTEFFIHGTPVVARATGGLTQQVVSHDVNPQQANGILYREYASGALNWQEQEHRKMQTTIDPVARMRNCLYRSQFTALTLAMVNAAYIYRHNKPAYGQILANLPGMCQRLSWQQSVANYRRWYDIACI